MDHHEYLLT